MVRCKGMEKLAMRETCEDAVKQGRLKGKASVDERGLSFMDLYIQYPKMRPGQMQVKPSRCHSKEQLYG